MNRLTHILAVVIAAAGAFALSPAGKALVAQYPVLSSVSAIVVMIAALYHQPIANQVKKLVGK